MRRIALTGGIAEGKTTVLRMFEALGATTLSSDALVAELMRPGTDLWNRLVTEFGQAIVQSDGSLARERLAQIAFGEAQARRRLNRLVHPVVMQAIAERIRSAETPLMLIEVPLLIEVAFQGLFDGIVVVQATPALQYHRLRERGVPASLARQILRSQLPTRAKIPFADWVIRTHRSLDHTFAQVQRVWHDLTA
ncbi:MAG: dephospho-CoA kinase [Armatimonadetes bacterium]|nr:dephospho-CoA kinase [Armatimonadota bacterium]CUU38302.1 dephospho-CoA kinase [Armatimonadetes bacterium DC]